jgi:hypothetical protein
LYLGTTPGTFSEPWMRDLTTSKLVVCTFKGKRIMKEGKVVGGEGEEEGESEYQ